MTNRLASESSPYLLQHKDNPVDWHPWGPEAFARAKAEKKPVFLSIGYSTCHWCHVMERESFENPALAAQLNRDFISIKVDREERPDVDDVYMAAVQAMTGTGGWPLSLFLTPDAKPFFGGTYFPPDDRYGRTGFGTVLAAVARAWKERPHEIEESGREMLRHLEASARGLPGGAAVGADALERAARSLEADFDAEHGGFDGAPKFPPAMRLDFLLRRHRREPGSRAREMVETTLERMAAGGIFDHVGGGFHRYSVDGRWLVPHFEKMLYDNAMLARVYLLAARAFGRADFLAVARDTLDYLLREMTPDDGGFFAAQDADSGGVEGSFYVWNPETVRAAVGENEAPLVAARFGVTPEGNFEHGETVLSVVRAVPDLARDFAIPEGDVARRLDGARRKMYDARAKRVAPATDDKRLTDWTALAVSAFALGARIAREPRYDAAARSAADRILTRCRSDGALLHRERGGRAEIPGFATDHAYMTEALLDLYEATFVPEYFREALALQEELDRRFTDPRGGYALSSAAHDGLILRPRELYDAAVPSSNSVAASNLLRLAVFTGDERYRRRAEEVFAACSGYLSRAPLALPRMLSALDFAEDPPLEIVIAGQAGAAAFEAMHEAVFASPNPNRVLAHADADETLADAIPLVAGRGTGGDPRAYVCRDRVCGLPLASAPDLSAALDG